jgi:tetratricopeptide (TPR) repeat protein
LAQLVGAELIYRRGTPPDAKYTFKHALVQDAAYGTLLRSRRRRLHAHIAATLEDRFPEMVAAQPALLGHHCEEAGMSEKAVGYWLAAGRQAWAGSAAAEAAALLCRGLALVPAVPDGDRRRKTELDLLIALRPALGITKGLVTAEVGETLTRARALAEELDRPEQLLLLLHGQAMFHIYRSEHQRALAIAGQIAKIGDLRGDAGAKLRARLLRGWTLFLFGEFVASRDLQEECLSFPDPAQRVISSDTYALMLAVLANTLTFLGYIDQAHSRLNEAFAESQTLGHPFTAANLAGHAGLRAAVERSPELQQRAEELLALATEHGFPHWSGLATALRGRSLCANGQAQDGHALLAQGLATIRADGAVLWTSLLLTWLAEACAALGQPHAGLNRLDEAAQLITVTGERLYKAELHRVRGDLLRAAADRSAAELSYRQAIAVAERQGAKLLELRTATSYARLMRDQGRVGEAYDLLAPVYGWFTEGFDTADLKEATGLLNELR